MNNTNQSDETVLSTVKQAIKAVKAGNRPLARLNLENTVTTEYQNPNYWIWVAWTADSPVGAISALEQALLLAPNHPLAQMGLDWARSMQSYDPDEYSNFERSVESSENISAHSASQQQTTAEEPNVEQSVPPEHFAEGTFLLSEAVDVEALEAMVETADEADRSASEPSSAEANIDTESAERLTQPTAIEDSGTSEPSESEVSTSQDVQLEAAEIEAEALESIDALQGLIDQSGSTHPKEGLVETTAKVPTSDEPDQTAQQNASAEANQTTEQTENAADQVDQRVTILAVDDSPTIRKIVSMSFERIGYRVVTASDGMEALRHMGECNPALILTDISMPQIDGYQLCKLIKSHDKTRAIPVIMLSGKDGMFDKIKGKFVGCDDYITKPFQSADLLEKVASYLPQPVSDS